MFALGFGALEQALDVRWPLLAGMAVGDGAGAEGDNHGHSCNNVACPRRLAFVLAATMSDFAILSENALFLKRVRAMRWPLGMLLAPMSCQRCVTSVMSLTT
mmetsp:Transcript_65980/g.176821  ORF Transcript_65980/g.176821 Transcript_65980/m.176821 type:complete len:102 (+) Transcript_65980:235-540(+)